MARPRKGVTFWDRVKANTVRPVLADSCWHWIGHKDECGYPRIRRGERLVRIHRAIWERDHGPIPAGKCVCHYCDYPGCVNPDHFFLGTHAQNMADCKAKGRKARLKGERNGCAKLTECQVLAIRASDETHARLARLYGVTAESISFVRRRITWKHL